MGILESKIDGIYFLKHNKEIHNILGLKHLIGYYSLLLGPKIRNEILKGLPQKGIFKDLAQIFNFIDIYYLKDGKYNFPSDSTPLPELIDPFYNRLVDHLIKSN